ncbi:head decoration protein [Salibacterium halotolerans]|uniref:Bacteriophage lambda head decoration protein D n=1 Tax=Salibacterium halotolerans TaxID=1884432 RepID=A0A1I5MMW9_9BACI|nr:head decoration protein [Salibacterium halotolerans]SFP10883.1 Bacteriophage lambda head decoration protein D [Salibacterium halotolerans]
MPENLQTNHGQFQNDNLFAGLVADVVTDSVTVKSGENLVRGTVVGLDTNNEAVAVDSANTDGSEEPFGVLAGDVDATNEALPGAVYLTGEFNEEKLTFGGSDAAADHYISLRDKGIFLKTNISAD